jgi:ribonuclease T2
VSWQPAICEGRPRKPECEAQGPGRFDATHFTLHGLWPQPRTNVYCGVAPRVRAADEAGDWDRLPAPDLAEATRARLEQVMPGTRSGLDRHEWIKHGTCFAGDAQAYYARSLALMDQLNGSKVRELFAANVGAEITGEAIRAAFDASFGEGTGRRVRVECQRDGSRTLIVEIKIGLAGEIGDAPSLARLAAASAPTDPGCPRGVVDPVGPQ